ncbi:MAG: hypothetical protein E7160_01725 [Firmicutes bacterium]|nr:hypothetical protein [Bacillota bacterium]
MKKRKLKKNVIFILITIILVAGIYSSYKLFFDTNEVKEVKILHKIKEYGYELKDSKSARYKKMFYELEKILKKSTVDEKAYVKKITNMFIYDFYTLDNKTAKTDVGGTDFIYKEILGNFLENAENTFYKYVESNIYNQRKQKLPSVDKIKISSVKTEEFKYGDKTDEEAYIVNVSWNYTDSKYDDYQKEATLVFIHNGKRLDLVELK